jgi:predicted phosphodiesterase
MIYTSHILYFDRKNPKIRLACFSDTHNGHKEFARNHFRSWVSKHYKHPYTWFIGLGDLIEAIGPFDPRFTIDHIDSAHHGKAAFIDAQIKDFISELSPYKDKIIGLGMGNHEYQVLKRTGSSPTDRICEALGVKNLGYSFLMALTLRPQNQGEGKIGGSRVLKIMGHHGWGGGTRSLGGDKTKVAAKPTEYVADLFMFGHSHQGWSQPKARLDVTSQGKPIARDYLYINTGTFKKTLSEGCVPSWEETQGFPVQKIGGRVVEIEIDPLKWLNIRVVE